MSKVEVDQVTQQSGTTLTVGGGACKTAVVDATTVTLGRCGGTVSLASGATQSGFGRTGTVDWQTGSIKTGTFTAVNGEGYFVDTSSGGVTCNLPAGSAGAIVSFSDYTNTWQNNSLTVTPDGAEKIGGIAADAILGTEGQSVTFVYVDGTEGWKNIQDSTSNVTGNQFMVASVSGSCNTITTCGNCKIATFKNPGTFCVSQVHPCAANNLVSYMVVAGGGGGGSYIGAGGGGGGLRETKSPVTPYTASPLCGYATPTNRITVSAAPYTIAVGGGGPAGVGPASPTQGVSGSVSTFSTITSAGGGGGGATPNAGIAGGSGGGGGNGAPPGCAGAGNTPPVTPPQGNDGGGIGSCAIGGGGGGGGATAIGATAPASGGNPGTNPQPGGNGGAGAPSFISGADVGRGGGGGGAGRGPWTSNNGGTATDGGGAGAYPVEGGTAGTAATGGGGGGGYQCSVGPAAARCGGNGGSGVVIIRYKFQ